MTPSPALDGHKGLRRATWEWTFRDRLACAAAGLRRRVRPLSRARASRSATWARRCRILLWRFDSRAKLYGIKLAKAPSDYIKDNILVTTSGMCSAEPLNCAIAALGHERIMFAADYPFEEAEEAGHWMDNVRARR